MADKLAAVAKQLAAITGNDALENPQDIGFIRFMMYSCVFFHAVYMCGNTNKCANCKAERLIRDGVRIHPELKVEVVARDSVITGERK